MKLCREDAFRVTAQRGMKESQTVKSEEQGTVLH